MQSGHAGNNYAGASLLGAHAVGLLLLLLTMNTAWWLMGASAKTGITYAVRPDHSSLFTQKQPNINIPVSGRIKDMSKCV